MNKVRENILLILLGVFVFSHSYTPESQDRTLREFSRQWRKINGKELRKGINYLYRLKYIDKEGAGYDIGDLSLTQKGRLRSLECQLNNLKNKKEKWDGKWRMVSFDIPEKYRQGRNALRNKLKTIGFCELQKSVLVAPYKCKEEIMLLVELFGLIKYVRFGVLEYVDNEDFLKNFYKLS